MIDIERKYPMNKKDLYIHVTVLVPEDEQETFIRNKLAYQMAEEISEKVLIEYTKNPALKDMKIAHMCCVISANLRTLETGKEKNK